MSLKLIDFSSIRQKYKSECWITVMYNCDREVWIWKKCLFTHLRVEILKLILIENYKVSIYWKDLQIEKNWSMRNMFFDH